MLLTVVCNFGENEETHNRLPDYKEKTTSLMSQIKTNQLLGQGMTYTTSEYIEHYYMFPKHPRPSNYHAFNV